MTEVDEPAPPVRVDQWLWAVRLFKTRSAAKAACETGKVKVNGESAKPARKVQQADQVAVRRRGVTSAYEVVRPITKRVGAKVAVECFIDHTPPEVQPAHKSPVADSEPFNPFDGSREPGAGRPTKRERRQIDKLRRR